MRFYRFDDGSGAHLGVLQGGELVTTSLADTVEQVAAGGKVLLDAIISDVAGKRGVALTSVRLLPPLRRPGKFLAIGMNYRAHAEEVEAVGIERPKQQYWFNKQTSCLNGPFDDIDVGVSEQVDYEVELGVIIGTPAKSVKADDVRDHIFGYTVVNDVSARDWQLHTPTFTMGKSFDTHGPVGPCVVTADEISDPMQLDLRCYVNEELRQSSNTSKMIYDIYQQIEYLSTAFTLESGDLIATGTPEGVGFGSKPPRFLSPGDVVRCEIDKIGIIQNRIAIPGGR